jgi:hypothetical protein
MKIPEEQARHMIGVTEVTYIPAASAGSRLTRRSRDLDDHPAAATFIWRAQQKRKGKGRT